VTIARCLLPNAAFELEVERQGDPVRKGYLVALVEYLAKIKCLQRLEILEIGSWAGASAIAFAKALESFGVAGRVLCVDLWKPYFDLQVNRGEIYQEMTKAAQSGEILETFRRNVSAAGMEHIIESIVGDSKEVLPTLDRKRFGIVFIDASHLYDDVATDIRNALPLVQDGGILCGDDFELRLDEVSAEAHELALRAGVDYVEDPRTRRKYHPGVTQAVADTLGRVTAWAGVWAVEKAGDRWQTIELGDIEPRIPDHLSQYTSGPSIVASQAGFNIIQHGARVLGIRQSLGEVDITVDPEELRRRYGPMDLVVCDTVDAVRGQIERVSLARRVEELEMKLAKLMGGKETQTGQPVLVGCESGFNIVACGGSVLGIRQSLGEVDVSVGAEELQKRFRPVDLVVGETIEGVRSRVGQLALSERVLALEQKFTKRN
jgi:predicted O-methyltransferase YrrM